MENLRAWTLIILALISWAIGMFAIEFIGAYALVICFIAIFMWAWGWAIMQNTKQLYNRPDGIDKK